MELTNCTYLLSKATVITPSSLKKLVVDDNECRRGTLFGLILEAPALVSLCLVGDVDFIVEDETPPTLPSLVDASIYTHEIKLLNDGIFVYEDTTGNQMQLLRMLANVTTLELSGLGVVCLLRLYTPFFLSSQSTSHLLIRKWDCVSQIQFQVHDDCLGLNFPQFTNLRTLSLDHCDLCDNFLLLKHFLRNSPNLMKLILCCCKVLLPPLLSSTLYLFFFCGGTLYPNLASVVQYINSVVLSNSSRIPNPEMGC
jgi:hypothetical protein